MGSYPVPSYGRWLARSDPAPVFRAHRRFLQLLQWRCPGERWVLKSPSYLAKLPAFFAEYPDAYVVLTHRDPLKVLPSLVSIMATLRWMHSDTVDVERGREERGDRHGDRDGPRHAVARRRHAARRPHHRRAVRRSRRRSVADDARRVRADGLGPHDRCRSNACARTSTRRPRERHGRHDYDFADTGLDLGETRARFAEYQTRYGVPSEL